MLTIDDCEVTVEVTTIEASVELCELLELAWGGLGEDVVLPAVGFVEPFEVIDEAESKVLELDCDKLREDVVLLVVNSAEP